MGMLGLKRVLCGKPTSSSMGFEILHVLHSKIW